MQVNTTLRVKNAPATPAERLLADVQALAPEITARIPEIEAARRLPLDLLHTLQSVGIFRMLAPRSHGGLELDLPGALRVITALGKIDGSVGWNAMIGSGVPMFAALLPREVFDHIFSKGPDVLGAGSSQPVGKAERVGGAWRVTGRWPLASGCHNADWLIGFCVMMQDGKPLQGAVEGMPLVKGCVTAVGDWKVEDNWHVAGLRGTGSSHISLTDVIVPDDHFIDVMGGKPCITGPLYGPVQQLVPLMHGAVEVGIAEGAIDDLVALVNTGRQQQRTTVPMRESEILKYELGRIEADLRAAKAAIEVQIESHWQHALAGTLGTEALLTEGAQTAVWVSKTCARVAEGCFALGGSSAIYDSSPLQRRMRDLLVASQHAVAHPRQYVNSGALLLSNAA